MSLVATAASFVVYERRRRSVFDKKPLRYAKTTEQHLIVRIGKSEAPRDTVLLRLTTDRHEASRGLSPTAELYISYPACQTALKSGRLRHSNDALSIFKWQPRRRNTTSGFRQGDTSLSSQGQKLYAKHTSTTYLNPRLKYHYFRC